MTYKQLEDVCPSLVNLILKRNRDTGYGPIDRNEDDCMNKRISNCFPWDISPEGDSFWRYLHNSGFKMWLKKYPDALEILGIKPKTPEEKAAFISKTINIQI